MKLNINLRKITALAMAAVLTLGLGLAQQAMPGMPDPGQAQRERQIMPFSLEATLHTFTNAVNGGTETVTVKNPKDSKNLALIRKHLQKEAIKFGRGDFSDPTFIHGKDMPGLAQVQAGAKSGRIKISYTTLKPGAQLRYITKDAALVKALHTWFAAQVMDHSSHAKMGR